MSDPRYLLLKDGTLMIEKTSEKDMGVYECIARSPMGQIKSRSARMEPHKQSFGTFGICWGYSFLDPRGVTLKS